MLSWKCLCTYESGLHDNGLSSQRPCLYNRGSNIHLQPHRSCFWHLGLEFGRHLKSWRRVGYLGGGRSLWVLLETRSTMNQSLCGKWQIPIYSFVHLCGFSLGATWELCLLMLWRNSVFTIKSKIARFKWESVIHARLWLKSKGSS